MDEDDAVQEDELAGLGGMVSAATDEQVEREMLNSMGCGETSEGPSKFDQLMALPDTIRLGEKTPFELKRETEDEEDLREEGEIISEDEDEYLPSEPESEKGFDHGGEDLKPQTERKPTNKAKKRRISLPPTSTYRDDGNDADFEARMNSVQSDETDEFHEIKKTYRIDKAVWNRLYKYQKTGVRWMFELHEHNVGGILADEMGLGKTIQVISFLRALDETQENDPAVDIVGLGPTLIVCPATLMQQWVKEFHSWMPRCRVAVLHSCGTFHGSYDKLISKMIVNRRGGSVLITSYATFTKEHKKLLNRKWHYVILDEGHKIRNPEAQATLALKDLPTPHRLILSGSPMQNNLKELWSLIDFVYPGLLGSLKTFTEKFAIPITQGGYANATELQATTAYKCAVILRDAINPYILRRMKKDVQMSIHLPDKNEQVLFCEITDTQRDLYKDYLCSRECSRILKGSMDAFVGMTVLRKLCNHPDLVNGGPNRHGDGDPVEDPSLAFGWYERSGKLVVVKNILALWRKGGHKALLFSQSRQMLSILETMLICEGYSYMRMDGTTSIGSRQKLVQSFNEDPSITVFLLTTRVGGLGINLTGANKVLIYDPDWNPSTDVQARERAWRIGQGKNVTVYRLISSGTIEEKIYHRQIFKQFLSNRILKDPKQRRFFKTNDLHELFALADKHSEGTETGALFAGTTTEINKENFFDKRDKQNKKKEKKRKKEVKEEEAEEDEGSVVVELTEEVRERLREMAKKIARNPELVAPPEGKVKSKTKLDGKHEIPGLVKQKKAKKEKSDKEKNHKKHSDDYVLGHLLESSGVRSAIKHDDLIVEHRSNYLVEHEADRVAQAAAESIRRPRKSHIAELKRETPKEDKGHHSDWSDGEEPAFSGKESKVGFLQAMRNRKRKAEAMNGGLELDSNDKFSKIAASLKEFLAKKGGSVYTNEIITKYKDKVKPTEQFHFRAILKKLATFNELRKTWTLRAEYQ